MNSNFVHLIGVVAAVIGSARRPCLPENRGPKPAGTEAGRYSAIAP